jgi:hypothetical protein
MGMEVEMVVSSIQFGDITQSTCCFVNSTGGASADLQINLGQSGGTPGILRLANNFAFGLGGIIDVQEAINVSSINGRTGNDINLQHVTGHAVSIYNATTSDFGTLQVGNITQISTISGLDAIFITTATSTLSVSTINNHPYPYPAGIFPVVNGTSVQTIPIPGVVSSSVVNVTYVHPNGSGGSQYLEIITPGTDNCVTTWHQNAATNETIIWSVLKF